MINYKQVQNYIETKNNIKLKPFQILALKAIIRGETIFLPRGCGYTTLYKGYADFLIERISKELLDKETIDDKEFEQIMETVKSERA